MGSTSTVAPDWKAPVARGHSAGPVKVELHRDWASVDRAAGGRLDRAPSLFERLAWFRLLATHSPPAGTLLALEAKGEEASWLFLAVEGSKGRAYANWYTLHFGAIGRDPAALAAIATALREQRPRIASIELAPLDPDDPLPAAFRAAGWLVSLRPATTRWSVETKGASFESYWAGRGSRLRNTVKRKGKAAGLEIEVHTSFGAQAWAAYEHVYARSWKPAEGSPAFLRALAEQESAASALRLGIARKDGEPVAAQLWLVENGKATIHKLAYVEEARELSAGTLLSAAMFRHAIDVDHVDHVDFGTGDDAYKAEWMDRKVELLRLVAFNPSTLGGITGAIRAKASELVRRARKH